MLAGVIKVLPLDLASTIRHDGDGGVADDLMDPAGLTAWVRARTDALGPWAADFVADEPAWKAALSLREAIRALFAHAVRPGPPSRADAGRLLPLDESLSRVNTAAVRATRRLDWSADEPAAATIVAGADLTALIGYATIEFLSGPLRRELRACTAPRCVRYFLKEHGRQEFCKPSCSNRARAARHYDRHRPTDDT
jgi:predicted RNA-binding Zn ribbon-like protein